MAICKMCHKPIPDGKDFCDECESKRTNQADESYLDRLLSSVSSDSDLAPAKKDRKREPKPTPVQEELPSMADIIADVIAEEEGNKKKSDISESDNMPADSSDILGTDDMPADSSDILGTDDILADSSDILGTDDIPVDSSGLQDSDEIASDASDVIATDDIPDDPFDVSSSEDVPLDISDEIDPAGFRTDNPDLSISDEITEGASPEEVQSSLGGEEPNEIDTMITDLLSEMPEDQPEPEQTMLDQDDIAAIFSQQGEADSQPTSEGGPDEVAEIEGIGLDEPVLTEDIPGLGDISEGPEMVDPFGGDITEASGSDDPEIQFINPGDEPSEENLLGADDLFALDDATISEQDIVNIGGVDSDGPIDIMSEIESGALEDRIKALEEPPKEKVRKKKKSFFQRIFGNVVEELTEEQKEARRKKAEEEEKNKAAILEAKKKSAEEAKAAKAAQKEIDKAEAEEKKKQAEEAKRKAKEEAREKAKKKKEAREALELPEEDEGKINKVGASILFILFAVITVFIILGTNTYSYNLSIENAQTDFLIRHYNEAYYDVYGLTIKDEDIELYDRIMTVMYVNSQLNSYNYYMKSHNDDKALNSLIKGLEKYEKYYMLATTLGITDDLEYVKTNILNELNNKFKITEEEAYSMMNINDVIDYSEYIYALLGTYDIEAIKQQATAVSALGDRR